MNARSDGRLCIAICLGTQPELFEGFMVMVKFNYDTCAAGEMSWRKVDTCFIAKRRIENLAKIFEWKHLIAIIIKIILRLLDNA